MLNCLFNLCSNLWVLETYTQYPNKNITYPKKTVCQGILIDLLITIKHKYWDKMMQQGSMKWYVQDAARKEWNTSLPLTESERENVCISLAISYWNIFFWLGNKFCCMLAAAASYSRTVTYLQALKLLMSGCVHLN